VKLLKGSGARADNGDQQQASEPASGETAPKPRRRSSGLLGILLVDALAMLLVVASGPAAYLWLGQSHLSPLAANASDVQPGATPNLDASAGASPAVGSSGAGSAAPSAALGKGGGTWTRTGSLPAAVWATASVILRDGRVMVVGGSTGTSSAYGVGTAAIFDPATGRWSAVTPMLQPRTQAMAVALADGSVLVAGGLRNGQPLDTAERYFPETGTWVAAGRLNLPRTQGTLTALGDGRVLAAGGGIEGSPGWASTASAEVFDPSTGAWSIVAPMSVARADDTATLLRNGDVLVAGGASTYHGVAGSVTAAAEIYSPRLNSWRTVAAMSKPRYAHGAALLNDGRVLVAGGWYSELNSDRSHSTAEIFDPVTNRWTVKASMNIGRAEHAMVSLPDGRVLAAGGLDNAYKVIAGSELYDPAVGLWFATGQLSLAVTHPAVHVLPDGRVLIAGGATNVTATKVTAVCEIYSPAPR
jgi:hypothetical protein